MSLAHRLRHRIAIQSPEYEQDSETGEMVLSWVDTLTDLPAEVLTGPGREGRLSGKTQAELSARITVRHNTDITEVCRVTWRGRIYGITGIETDRTDKKEMRLTCVDMGSQGL